MLVILFLSQYIKNDEVSSGLVAYNDQPVWICLDGSLPKSLPTRDANCTGSPAPTIFSAVVNSTARAMRFMVIVDMLVCRGQGTVAV